MRHVVLLRGINVGGRNRLSMVDLRDHLNTTYVNIRTYLQSGNIVLDTEVSAADVGAHIERDLPDLLTLDSDLIRVVVYEAEAYRNLIASAPSGFGAEPDKYRYDVWFYLGVTPRDIEPHLSVNDEVDDVYLGESALYHRRLIALATRSRVARHLLGTPVYEALTVRNWRTTSAIAAMLDATEPA